MFTFDGINSHNYSFAVIGLGKKSYSKVFPTREAANQHMYNLCSKHGLQITEV
jgi:hypothetical protein